MGSPFSIGGHLARWNTATRAMYVALLRGPRSGPGYAVLDHHHPPTRRRIAISSHSGLTPCACRCGEVGWPGRSSRGDEFALRFDAAGGRATRVLAYRGLFVARGPWGYGGYKLAVCSAWSRRATPGSLSLRRRMRRRLRGPSQVSDRPPSQGGSQGVSAVGSAPQGRSRRTAIRNGLTVTAPTPVRGATRGNAPAESRPSPRPLQGR
jgi:hypothetical protein